jgi:hypothetical protein
MLPHEVSDEAGGTKGIDARVILGLVGLAIEVEDGFDFGTLSPDQACRAARYALHEINGLPKWLEPFARIRPEETRQVLCESITVEWQTPANKPHAFGVLSRIRSNDDGLRALVTPRIMDLLRDGDPPHGGMLNQAIRLLVSSSANQGPALVRELAPSRIVAYQPTDHRFLIWLITWLQLEGVAAAEFLDQSLRTHPESAVALLIGLGSAMSDRRGHDYPIIAEPSYLSSEALLRLVPLFFENIRRADDIERAGTGVYSPSPRDDAQSFRSQLLQALSESADPRAFVTLVALLDETPMASERDLLLHLIDRRAQRDAEGPPWQPEDIAAFTRNNEVRPRSGDALFRIAVKRLTEIKDEVEAADFNSSNDVRIHDSEEILQLWLARQLDHYSRGIYKVVRENEVHSRKKPDIQLLVPGIDPSTIEIKWASSWTYKELFKALEDQLVGQYLKSNHSRHGLLVLANANPTRTWEFPDGTNGNLRQVAAALQMRALEITRGREDIDELLIWTLNFTASGA